MVAALRARRVETFVSHSSLGLDERQQTERAFAQGRDCVIVAISALELGIEVGDLDRVIQIDAPLSVSSFLQRMGRTGRRPGAARNCLFLATSDEGLLRVAGLIELWSAGFVEPAIPPPRPAHILAQQLALALQERGVGRSEWFGWVRGVPAFGDMDRAEVEGLVDWMLEREILWDEAGVLWFGREGQDVYGRKNFLDLVSVFTAPPLFTVQHAGRELGSVDESTFLARRDDGPPVLLLAGRAWRVVHLDWKRRQAHVEPAEDQGRSRWRGQGQFLSRELCGAIRGVLAADGVSARWSRRARSWIGEARAGFPWLTDEPGTSWFRPATGSPGGRSRAGVPTPRWRRNSPGASTRGSRPTPSPSNSGPAPPGRRRRDGRGAAGHRPAATRPDGQRRRPGRAEVRRVPF